MSWPAHSAENEPLSASRTYGCCRTRSTVSIDGSGIVTVTEPGATASASKVDSDGEDMPVPALPRTSGRWRATAPVRAGDRPVSAPGSPARNGRPDAASSSRRVRIAASSASSSSCGTRTTAAKRKKARPRVRKTSPIDATFWMIGKGIGMTSANGPRWSRNEASSAGGMIVWSDVVTSAGWRPASSRLGR